MSEQSVSLAVPCHLSQRIRRFFRLPEDQQKALLEIVDELLAMNGDNPPPPVAARPLLYAVK